MIRIALLSALLLAFAYPQDTVSKDPNVEAIIKEGRDNSKVQDHLDGLVNKIGPRLTSSDNLTKACEWARDRFKEYGLDAKIEEWGTFPVGFNRGPWSGKIVSPKEQKIECATMAWTAGTKGAVRGKAVALPLDEEGFDKIKDKLKGAWVVEVKRSKVRKIRDLCEEAGAAGFVINNGSDLIVTDGSSRVSWEKLPTRVIVYVTSTDFKAITTQMSSGEVELEFDIKNEFVKGPIKLYNVIADLKGAEKPDEYVVLGGHIDSWDGARGAVDNGTGCATTIEAARILSKLPTKPRRTIRFMLWSGEEQGLLGSTAYVKAHKDEMAKYSAVYVHDGGTNYLSGIYGTDAMCDLFEKIFEPVKALNKDMPFKIRRGFVTIPFSDHAPFVGAGVPAFFWDQAGRSNYNHAHHTQHDVFDFAIPEYQVHSSIVASIAAWGTANLDGLLPREGMSEGGRRPRRRLGAQVTDALKVETVTDGMAGAKAGLKVGDLLKSFDGEDLLDREDLTDALRKAGKKAKLVVERDGKTVELELDFASAAEEPPQRLLGIQLTEGMTIGEIFEGSVAEKTGLKIGDVILKIGDKSIEDQNALRAAMNEGGPKKKITIEREGKALELDVEWPK